MFKPNVGLNYKGPCTRPPSCTSPRQPTLYIDLDVTTFYKPVYFQNQNQIVFFVVPDLIDQNFSRLIPLRPTF